MTLNFKKKAFFTFFYRKVKESKAALEGGLDVVSFHGSNGCEKACWPSPLPMV